MTFWLTEAVQVTGSPEHLLQQHYGHETKQSSQKQIRSLDFIIFLFAQPSCYLVQNHDSGTDPQVNGTTLQTLKIKGITISTAFGVTHCH